MMLHNIRWILFSIDIDGTQAALTTHLCLMVIGYRSTYQHQPLTGETGLHALSPSTGSLDARVETNCAAAWGYING
jgi:hypothetical protein